MAHNSFTAAAYALAHTVARANCTAPPMMHLVFDRLDDRMRFVEELNRQFAGVAGIADGGAWSDLIVSGITLSVCGIKFRVLG